MRLLPVAVMLSCVACQTYTFERIEPHAVATKSQKRVVVARGLKPNVMLAVDASGSMGEPIDGSRPECTLANGTRCGVTTSPCPSACATRLSEVKRATTEFLTELNGQARVGLSVFPSPAAPDACAPGVVQVPIPSSDAMTIDTSPVATALSRLQGKGGTPTASTLWALTEAAGLNDPKRSDFVLLLTDGLPNCDPENPADVNTCECTSVKRNPTDACERRACLDTGGAVRSVRELRRRDIRTVVIGFGAETATSVGGQVLDTLAREGGVRRSCSSDSECGAGDRCTQGACGRGYYQAVNALELGTALSAVSADILHQPCETVLDETPADPRLLAVLIDGASVPSGVDTWSYADGKLVFARGSALCTRMEQSTPENPVQLEIRTAEIL